MMSRAGWVCSPPPRAAPPRPPPPARRPRRPPPCSGPSRPGRPAPRSGQPPALAPETVSLLCFCIDRYYIMCYKPDILYLLYILHKMTGYAPVAPSPPPRRR